MLHGSWAASSFQKSDSLSLSNDQKNLAGQGNGKVSSNTALSSLGLCLINELFI